MPKYTKYTIVTFTDPKTEGYSEGQLSFNKDSLVKLKQYASDGTMHTALHAGDNGGLKRYWVDQAAAEEWKSFLLQSAEKYGVEIASIEIGDNETEPVDEMLSPPPEDTHTV